MNKKTLTILLLALLLVVGLFVVSLSLGAREPSSGPKFDPKAPNLEFIANWLSRPAKAENLTLRSGGAADCRLENRQIIIQPNATCLFSVPSDKVWTFKLRLKLLSPQEVLGEVKVTLEQPEALAVESNLEPGQTLDLLDIYGRKDQAVATLKIEVPPAADSESTEYVIEVVEK